MIVRFELKATLKDRIDKKGISHTLLVIITFFTVYMQAFLSTFKKLPLSNKSMVYLMWIQEAGTIIVDVFINIYIFQINQSLLDVALYNFVYYGSVFLGFSAIGWCMAWKQKNIKYMYYIGYITFILSFLPLIFLSGDYTGILTFAVLYGTGYGAFWNAVHSQELKNITDQNRDFYSSSISAGVNIIHIIIPLCIAALFYLSGLFYIDGYLVLFFTLPIIYMTSFIFIRHIDDYIPQKISRMDVCNFFNFKKYKFGHAYYLLGGFKHGLEIVIIPVVTILLLKSEVSIGIFQAILGILSTLSVMYFATKRTPENRVQYFLVLSICMFINYIGFALFYDLFSFIIFSLVLLLLHPLFRVSEHTYDLALMDNVKIPGSDFYPSMILREVFLAIGRLGSVVILIILFYYGFDLQTLLQIGIICIGLNYILKSGLIYFWERYEKTSQ